MGSTDETTAATTAAATTEASTTTPAGQTSANNGQPIVIGSAYPAVNAPTDAEQMVGGSGLAIAEINAAGGVAGRPIEHEIVDMNSFDAASVTAGFNDIVSKEVDAIIFGYHNVFEPNDIAAAYGAPFLNASTSIAQVTAMKSDTQKYANIFQCDPTEVPYGTGFPPFLEALIAAGLFNPPTKTIFIIEGDIVYGRRSRRLARTRLPKPAGRSSASNRSTPRAGRLRWPTGRRSSPRRRTRRDRGLQHALEPADHAAFMKAWVADPADAFVYLQYGASVPEFLELAGDAAEGAVWATVLGTMNDTVGLAFQERYQAQNNAPAGFSNAGTGYDEVYLLAHAWGITGDTRNFAGNIAELRRNIYRGVSGGYWFGHDDTANYCLSYPAEIQDPGLGNPHLFFQILPDDSGELSHQIIDPAPYIQSEYIQQPWLSF